MWVDDNACPEPDESAVRPTAAADAVAARNTAVAEMKRGNVCVIRRSYLFGDAQTDTDVKRPHVRKRALAREVPRGNTPQEQGLCEKSNGRCSRDSIVPGSK